MTAISLPTVGAAMGYAKSSGCSSASPPPSSLGASIDDVHIILDFLTSFPYVRKIFVLLSVNLEYYLTLFPLLCGCGRHIWKPPFLIFFSLPLPLLFHSIPSSAAKKRPETALLLPLRSLLHTTRRRLSRLPYCCMYGTCIRLR